MSDNWVQVMEEGAASYDLPAGLTEADLKQMYEGMIMIRAYDERALKLQRSGRIGFCVTSFGEEATQVGTAHALRPDDWVFPAYRQYGVPLYRGASMTKMAAHLFGNADDSAKGRQMPAHYTFDEHRFVSASSVIGSQIIHAVGCAMAIKYRKSDEVAVTYFGDGASSANDFHSSLNFAGVYKPPVLFFLVNNQYAISLPVEKQTGISELYKKAEGYGVHGIRVDGNDVIAVYKATREAAQRARDGKGATLLELFTYRVGAHSSSDDPTRYREKDETAEWKEKDPIERMKRYLQQLNIWTEEYEAEVWEQCRTKLSVAITKAEQIGDPPWESAFENVYAEMPSALEAQKQELLDRESGLELNNEGEFPL
ncbi:MAG: thiamine pyrophosphate-dependent dehydrogenase E1 component subunit alpha [Vampirovibrio sp.]|nr:thiamine pyrophosphate-dependent dehydrogenase E1 component subunit alpha [Vampirovibrio sp.]